LDTQSKLAKFSLDEKGAQWQFYAVCILEALKTFSVICPFYIPHGCSNFQQGNKGFQVYSFL
jgi:hypothetical protein